MNAPLIVLLHAFSLPARESNLEVAYSLSRPATRHQHSSVNDDPANIVRGIKTFSRIAGDNLDIVSNERICQARGDVPNDGKALLQDRSVHFGVVHHPKKWPSGRASLFQNLVRRR